MNIVVLIISMVRIIVLWWSALLKIRASLRMFLSKISLPSDDLNSFFKAQKLAVLP